jgi:hypothetical protein
MAAIPVAGCYTHQCDPSTLPFDAGDWIDDFTYETSALSPPALPDGGQGGWIDYTPNVTLVVTYPAGGAVSRRPVSIDSYIGISSTPNDDPNDSGINFTSGAGGLVEYSDVNSTGFRAMNGTCGKYFARFVVHFVSATDDASADDASADDASADDAAPDDVTQAAAAGDAE